MGPQLANNSVTAQNQVITFLHAPDHADLSTVLRDIGEILVDVRGKRCLSMNHAAKFIGCPYGIVRRIETGENTELQGFFTVTKAYGISFELHHLAAKDDYEPGLRKHALKSDPADVSATIDQLMRITNLKRQAEGFEPGQIDPLQKDLSRYQSTGNLRLKQMLQLLLDTGIYFVMVVPYDYSTQNTPRIPSADFTWESAGENDKLDKCIRVFEGSPSLEDALKKIGQIVAEIRRRDEKTLDEVADSSGTSFGTFQRCEKGANLALGGLLAVASTYQLQFELHYMSEAGSGVKKWKKEILALTETPYALVLGNIIREARMELGLNQTEAATKFSLNRNELSRIENGTTEIMAKTFLKLLFSFSIDLVLVLPEQRKARPFDKIKLPASRLKSNRSDKVEKLLDSEYPLTDLLTKIGTVIHQVRSSKHQSLRIAGDTAEVDNSKLAKFEKGEIDMQVSTFIALCQSIGVNVVLVYPVIPKRQKAALKNTVEIKRYNVTRSRHAPMEGIGRIIRSVRKDFKKSLRDLEDETGINNSKLGKIEKNRLDPRMTTLAQVLVSVGISLELIYTPPEEQ